jgi:hypothetical protein
MSSLAPRSATLRTDAPRIPANAARPPYRLDAEVVDIGALFSAAEIAEWKALHPALPAAWVDDALHPSELIAEECIYGVLEREDAAAMDPFGPAGTESRLIRDRLLVDLLTERAVRTAHKEGLLWSPLLSHLVYDHLSHAERMGEYGDDAWEEESLGDEPRRAAYLEALGRWMVSTAGTPEASVLLERLPASTRRSLAYWVGAHLPLTAPVVRWLATAAEGAEGVLAEAATLTPEAAARLGEHLAAELSAGAAGWTAPDALRALRQRGLWTWQPAAAEVAALWDEARRTLGYLPAQQDAPGLPDAGPSTIETHQQALRAVQCLIDQADRGAPFPAMEEITQAAGTDVFYFEWAGSSPFLDEDGVRALLEAGDRVRDRSLGGDLSATLASNDAALGRGEVRRWILGGRDDGTLHRLLERGVWEGDEVRIAFRRLSLLSPYRAVCFLDEHADAAEARLQASDLSVLLASAQAEARMAAIQFLSRLPNPAERPDPLPAPEVAQAAPDEAHLFEARRLRRETGLPF